MKPQPSQITQAALPLFQLSSSVRPAKSPGPLKSFLAHALQNSAIENYLHSYCTDRESSPCLDGFVFNPELRSKKVIPNLPVFDSIFLSKFRASPYIESCTIFSLNHESSKHPLTPACSRLQTDYFIVIEFSWFEL